MDRVIPSVLFFLGTFAFFVSSISGPRKDDVPTNTGRPSVLVKAVEANDTLAFQKALQGDIDVNALHFDFQTALMAAAQLRRVDFVRELLKAGADVNAKNKRNWTALHFAVLWGNSEIVQLLVDAKSNVNEAEETFGLTPLMWAARDGNLKTIDILVDAGANLFQKDKFGKSAILFAAEGGKPEVIKKFLSLGFDANTADDYSGRTALIAAVRYPEAIKVLMEAGAKVNDRQTVLGMTALYVAAQNGWTDSVRVLIDAGADVNISDTDGQTPLNRAIVGKHTEVADLLRKAGAKD
jgi:ankyrin repeat protein